MDDELKLQRRQIQDRQTKMSKALVVSPLINATLLQSFYELAAPIIGRVIERFETDLAIVSLFGTEREFHRLSSLMRKLSKIESS